MNLQVEPKMVKTHNRTCCACRRISEKKELVRVVRNKEGEVSLDLTGKANGRGAYLCKDAQCLQKARRNKALEKALGVTIPEEVYESFEQELEAVND